MSRFLVLLLSFDVLTVVQSAHSLSHLDPFPLSQAIFAVPHRFVTYGSDLPPCSA